MAMLGAQVCQNRPSHCSSQTVRTNQTNPNRGAATKFLTPLTTAQGVQNEECLRNCHSLEGSKETRNLSRGTWDRGHREN